MKHTIRIITAVLALGFIAACADKAQPPVQPKSNGKTVVPAGR